MLFVSCERIFARGRFWLLKRPEFSHVFHVLFFVRCCFGIERCSIRAIHASQTNTPLLCLICFLRYCYRTFCYLLCLLWFRQIIRLLNRQNLLHLLPNARKKFEIDQFHPSHIKKYTKPNYRPNRQNSKPLRTLIVTPKCIKRFLFSVNPKSRCNFHFCFCYFFCCYTRYLLNLPAHRMMTHDQK